MSNEINILIAEDNEISRELMASILKTHGYNVIHASDGDEAIKTINQTPPDLALVDLNMEPKGGFAFVKHLVANDIDLPVVIITADDSSDVLMRASELGVTRVLQKPVDPDRLISITQNILKRFKPTAKFIPPEVHAATYTHEQLMQRAIDIAEHNAVRKKGGPFGAIVADQNGYILGEGTNGITSRFDPTAHAEIMAIRHAAEKLESSDLSHCLLYCSSEPTMMGQALIISVGIAHVYYGLSHAEISEIRDKENKVRLELGNADKTDTRYTQTSHDSAIAMFKRWQAMNGQLKN